MKNRYLTAFIIVLQLMFIGYLVQKVYSRNSNNVTVSVAPILRSDMIVSASSTLKNFYELNPGAYDNAKPEWLGDYPLLNRINTDALNERFEYEVAVPQNTYRIAVLGDSWVYGQFTSTKDNFSEQLEDLLNTKVSCEGVVAFEVINLGVPNYDIAFASERFRLRGQKYNPDTVIWLMNQNDFDSNTDYFMDAEQSEFEYLQQHSTAEDFGSYNEATGYKGMFVSNGADILHVEATVRAYNKMRTELSMEDILNFQLSYFEKFKDVFKKNTILYAPIRVFNYPSGTLAMIRRFKEGSPNISVYESPINLEESAGLYPDVHPNPRGHGLIAKDLMDYLLATELSECTLKS